MEKCRKIFSLALMSMAAFVFAPTGVQADYSDTCYDPCCDDDNGFSICADFLYWKPCVDEVDYAASRKGKNYSIKTVSLDWEPGFRVSVGKSDCCCGWDLSASYTYVDVSSSSSTKSENNIMPTNSHAGFIDTEFFDRGHGRWSSEYQEWDIRAGFGGSCNQCYDISHFIGVAGIVVDQKLQSTVRGDGLSPNPNALVERTTWDSDFWGVGLRIGTDYSYKLSDCLSFFANGHATILAGEADTTIKFDSRDSGVSADHKFTEEKFCQIVPGYHIATGLSYNTSFCNSDFSLRLGYEFIAWHNMPSERTFVNDANATNADFAISTSSNTRTYGFHGLFAGACFSF